MKYYIIAGEASGDLHGSNLIKAIKKRDTDAEFRCWGGDLMQAQGVTLVKHIRDLAFMGFWEVLLNLGTILRNIQFCKSDIEAFTPDVLILIDYPGFNLRIAKYAKEKLGLKVVYYISPQVWAWKSSRVEDIKKCVDKMLVILPFEKDFYAKYGYEVEYVGHPLMEAIGEFLNKPVPIEWKKEQGISTEKLIVALLPGSRRQEIKTMLKVFMKLLPEFPDVQFVIAGAPSIPKEFYETITQGKIPIVFNQTYELLRQSHTALVTSGTATLETALIGIPQVVCYKGGWVSYFIARWLIKHIRFISLVNLILDKPLVRELIQGEMNQLELKKELQFLSENKTKREEIIDGYNKLRKLLQQEETASEKAAKVIELFLHSKN